MSDLSNILCECAADQEAKGMTRNADIFFGIADELDAKDQRIAELEAALSFYGDPTVYHGISILADHPTGGFDEDVSMTDMYDYPKPGKLARKVLGFTPECNLTALNGEQDVD
jgi:hypothetical protein